MTYYTIQRATDGGKAPYWNPELKIWDWDEISLTRQEVVEAIPTAPEGVRVIEHQEEDVTKLFKMIKVETN